MIKKSVEEQFYKSKVKFDLVSSMMFFISALLIMFSIVIAICDTLSGDYLGALFSFMAIIPLSFLY